MITAIFAVLFCAIFIAIVRVGLKRCQALENHATECEKATRWQQKILKMPIQEGAKEQQKWRAYVNSIHSRKNNIRSI